MNIIMPCNWKTVDLLKTDNANDFGEALRGYCFIGNNQEIGCYSTFEVNKVFKQMKSGKIFQEAKKYLYEDIKPNIYHYKLKEKDCYMSYEIDEGTQQMKICEPYEIVMGWTWDGDGCLYFRFNDRKVVNSDCKKDYTWEWRK